MLGRTSGIRFAIRESDRGRAEEALFAAGFPLKDCLATPGASNVDEPIHRTFDRQSVGRWLPWLLLAAAAGLTLGTWFCTAYRG